MRCRYRLTDIGLHAAHGEKSFAYPWPKLSRLDFYIHAVTLASAKM